MLKEMEIVRQKVLEKPGILPELVNQLQLGDTDMQAKAAEMLFCVVGQGPGRDAVATKQVCVVCCCFRWTNYLYTACNRSILQRQLLHWQWRLKQHNDCLQWSWTDTTCTMLLADCFLVQASLFDGVFLTCRHSMRACCRPYWQSCRALHHAPPAKSGKTQMCSSSPPSW